MITCSNCNAENDSANTFCQNCGANLIQSPAASAQDVPATSGSGGLAGLERGIFFKAVRVIASVLAIAALGGMLYSGAKAVTNFAILNATPKDVTPQEILLAIEAEKNGRSIEQSIAAAKIKLNPADLAALDKAIYELLALVPAEQIQNVGGIDGARSQIKRSLSQMDLPSLADQAQVVGDARNIVSAISEPERFRAIQFYFQILDTHKQEAKVSARKGAENMVIAGSAFAASSIFLILVTVVLVLLSIERNTRR